MHRKLAILIVLLVLVAATLPAAAQQAYTPTFGEWVHVWTKANVEQLYRLSEGIYGESKVGSVERLRGMTPAYQITVVRGDDPAFEQRKQELLQMLKEQIQLWQAAGMDISMDDFRIVQKNAPDSDHRIQRDLQNLNTQTQLYKFKTGGEPPSIEALVKEGYLNEAPDAAGGKFVMGEDGVWSHVPGEQPKAEEAPKPATPQQLDRWNKSYTPALGEWAFIWAKSNFETLLPTRAIEGQG